MRLRPLRQRRSFNHVPSEDATDLLDYDFVSTPACEPRRRVAARRGSQFDQGPERRFVVIRPGGCSPCDVPAGATGGAPFDAQRARPRCRFNCRRRSRAADLREVRGDAENAFHSPDERRRTSVDPVAGAELAPGVVPPGPCVTTRGREARAVASGDRRHAF